MDTKEIGSGTHLTNTCPLCELEQVGGVSDSSQAITEKNDHGAGLAAAPTIPEYADIRAASEIEHKYRRELWLNHGHSGAALYGDDGEMQCRSCMTLSRLYDYKRAPLADVESAVYTARMQRVGQALAGAKATTEVSSAPAASPAQEEKSNTCASGEAIERRQEEEIKRLRAELESIANCTMLVSCEVCKANARKALSLLTGPL